MTHVERLITDALASAGVAKSKIAKAAEIVVDALEGQDLLVPPLTEDLYITIEGALGAESRCKDFPGVPGGVLWCNGAGSVTTIVLARGTWSLD